MIGQVKNKNLIDTLIKENTLSHTILILGDVGSGRKTISDYIKNALNIKNIADIEENSIENVREVISTAVSIEDEKLIVRFTDIDKMSIGGKNALLKTLEEPRPNVYYIITGRDTFDGKVYDIPDTIKSRSFIINTENYTKENLKEYLSQNDNKYSHVSEDTKKLAVDIANNIGELQLLLASDIKTISKFATKIIENIATSYEYNIYKIGNSINKKDTDQLYDFNIVLMCILNSIENKMIEDSKNINRYLKYSKICNKYLDLISRAKTSKFFAIDDMIDEMKKCN